MQDRHGGGPSAPAARPEPLALLSSVRSQLIRERFLHFGELRARIEAAYPSPGRMPRELADAMKALERMVSSVNLLVTTALATHPLLTLVDLEHFILRTSRDFEGLATFDEAKLGPLHTHPAWQRACPMLTAGAGLSGEEVIRYLVGVMAEQRRRCGTDEEAFSPVAGLDALAATNGLSSYMELGVHLRAETWLTFVMRRAAQAAAKAEKRAKDVVKEEAAKIAFQAYHSALAAEDAAPSTLEAAGSRQQAAGEARPDLSAQLFALPDEGKRFAERFVEQLREWMSAPPSAGMSLTLPPLSKAQRKLVHKLLERDAQLSHLQHCSSGEEPNRVLTISRMRLMHGGDAAAPLPTDAPPGAEEPGAHAAEAELGPSDGEVLACVRGLLDELSYIDAPIDRLAKAELQLLHTFDASTFDALHLPQSSFAAYCSAHSAELEAYLSSSGASGGNALSEAARDFAAALLARLPNAHDAALEEAMRSHFGVGCLKELGWRSMPELRARVQHGGVSRRPCALVLAATQPSSVTSSVPVSRGDAVAAVHALAPLTDVAAGTHWPARYQLHLGSLAAFVAAEDLPVLQVSHGSFVKLEGMRREA